MLTHTQVVDDPFFLDMFGYSSMGVTTGVLDDDGFQCPQTPHTCVSALALRLDIAYVSIRQHTHTCVSALALRLDIAYVSIRQHTHTCASALALRLDPGGFDVCWRMLYTADVC
jgi:hypothetical protein